MLSTLSTLGTIKDLPLYRNHFRSMRTPHTPYTPFDDSQFPYVTWKIEIDEDQYTDWQEIKDQYGEFSKDWSSIKVADHNGKWFWYKNWDDMPYYHPSSNDDTFSYFHAMGCSKQVARELERAQINQSIKALRAWHKGDRCHLIVTVKAFIDGTLIAHDCIGGIEVESSNDPYVADVIDDLKRSIAHDLPKMAQEKLNQAAQIYAKVNAS